MSHHDACPFDERREQWLDEHGLHAPLPDTDWARCPHCQTEIEQMKQMEAALLDLNEASEMEKIIKEAASTPPGMAEERFRRSLVPSLPRERKSSRHGKWLAAAAAILLALAWWVPRQQTPSVAPQHLGPTSTLQMDAPIGTVTEFREFRWSSPLPPTSYYLVTVYSNSGDELRRLLRSPRLQEPRWEPPAAEVAKWPDQIRWTVEIVKATGAHTVIESGTATAQRSSP